MKLLLLLAYGLFPERFFSTDDLKKPTHHTCRFCGQVYVTSEYEKRQFCLTRPVGVCTTSVALKADCHCRTLSEVFK
jgi:hypothetical protein